MLTVKKWLNKYFGFTKREYSGLLTLIVILLLVSALPYFYSYFFSKPALVTTAEQKAVLKLMLVNEQEPDQYRKGRWEIADEEEKMAIQLFKFDPNQIDVVTWQQLGLSLKQAQSIVNYRNKGGKFYKPEDLKKMYTIKPEKYAQLAPYIEIEKIDNKYAKRFYPEKSQFPKKEFVIIDINNADSAQLDQIKGIGPAFARRIVEYRTRLGGFYKKDQLMEVYGVDSLKFNEIKEQIMLDNSELVKININTVEFESLKKHPYLIYKQVNAILQYRKQHGKFNSIDDLKKVAILTPQNIERIAPYLTF